MIILLEIVSVILLLLHDSSQFPISRSLSTSRRRTDDLGSRLERPIHFECKLNEPMNIGMRLLHPAAADHSVSISRQQVQRIFSFLLRSQAVTSFCSWLLLTSEFNELSMLFGRLLCWWTALQRWWFFPCRVECTHQAALPRLCCRWPSPLCDSAHAKRVFSLKEHSRVRLFKDDVASGKLDIASL